MTAPSIMQATRAEVDRRLREELAVRLTHGHDAILRRVPDLYRRIIGEALLAEGGQTGKAAQLRAAQRALDRIANIGVVDFVDAAGRKWNMQSYVEMAVRTAAMRAMTDAHLAVLTERGFKLVYVTNVAGTCKLCIPWQSVVLSIGPLAAPFQVLDRVIAFTVQDALDAGLQHPGCRHLFKAWRPGLTVIPPPTPDPEGYEAQQQLRALERQVRLWKRREAAAFTPEARRQAEAKIADWQGAIRAHVAASGVRRLPGREGIDAPLPSPTPRAR